MCAYSGLDDRYLQCLQWILGTSDNVAEITEIIDIITQE